MSKKLEKVLEHLIKGEEAEAKELLHQVFIEKARAIHEELINMDEEQLDELGGDEGDDFMKDVEDESEHLDELSDEIEAEETMAEDEDIEVVDAVGDLGDEMGAEDDMMDAEDDMMDMADVEPAAEPEAEMPGEMGDIEGKMDDLEDALAALKAEFEKLEAGDVADMDDAADDMEDAEEDMEDAEDSEEDAEEDSEEMDESWLEEFDDLEESVDLEKVAAPSGPEAGSGKFASPEAHPKSPVNKAPTELMGAKPVQIGKGPEKSGYEREAAPSSQELPLTKDNRRKKAEDGMSKVSKEGDAQAKLNKTKSEFGADTNKKSPLTNSPRK